MLNASAGPESEFAPTGSVRPAVATLEEEEFGLPYVMVPVPEEHVEAVMQFILRSIARAAAEDWDTASVTELWTDVDEASRGLLAYVARAASEGRELDVVDAARQLEVSVRETTALVNELNGVARETTRPAFFIMRVVSERLPNGRITEKRVLQMDPELAELVTGVERAELLEAPQPTGESTD